MSSSENSDVDDIAEKLHQVHIERHRLHEREQALIKQLIEARKRRRNERSRSRSGVKANDREVDARIYGVAQERGAESTKRDRFGTALKVGDRVEFLTSGRLVGKIWTVYKLTEKRVLCERHDGVHKAFRDYKNVRKVN